MCPGREEAGMSSRSCPAPRGLAARIVWVGLVLYERVKRQAFAPPQAGGTMGTEETAPFAGAGDSRPMVAHGLTHTGKRARNEDCHLIREDLGLVVMADGFSGAAGGDIAARLAVDEIAACFDAHEEQTLPDFDAADLEQGLAVATVRFAIERAHRHVGYHARRTGPPGMCAAVAVLLVAGPRVVIGHAGSVRVYRFRSDTLELLTNDGAGWTPIVCPIGAASAKSQQAIHVERWIPGDAYLLCTTGLHRVLATEPIRCTLAAVPGVRESVAALVGRAIHAGAADNMTAVVARPAAVSSPPEAAR